MSAADSQELSAQTLEFSPAIVRIQKEPPSPLPRMVLYALLGLLGVMAVWSVLGRLDIIAVAPGKLVPSSYVKVVQPADAGINKQILVREGDAVKAGQVLVQMDTAISNADSRQLQTQLQMSLVGVNGGDLFHPAEYGMRTLPRITSCWRGFVCTYKTLDNKLFLDTLQINLGQEGPQINNLGLYFRVLEHSTISIKTLICILTLLVVCLWRSDSSRRCMSTWVFILPGNMRPYLSWSSHKAI